MVIAMNITSSKSRPSTLNSHEGTMFSSSWKQYKAIYGTSLIKKSSFMIKKINYYLNHYNI